MQISGYANYIPQVPSRAARSNTSFAQALNTTADDTVNKPAPASALTDTDAGSNEKRDYSNMTPREFSEAGKQLYKEGKIDLDQLFQFQWAAGDFNSEGNGSSESTKPVNYIAHFQDKLLCAPSVYGDSNKKMVKSILDIIAR